MQLTPTIKFLAIAFAFIANVMLWIWTGIQADAFALGLNVHVYNIIMVIISGCVTASSAALFYFGLRPIIIPVRLKKEDEVLE